MTFLKYAISRINFQNYSPSRSSNLIFLSGIFETGMNNDRSPLIFITIDIEYRIDSGNTNEYHAINSPNANSPNPTPTASAPFCFPSMYETMVSIEPYTSKINEKDLMICSIFIADKKNNGKIPTDLK